MTPAQRAEFLAERRKGLGASDVAVVLGVSRYRTPAILCAEKLGLLEDSPSTDEQLWGLRHEPTIAAAFTEETGLPVAKPLGFYVDPACEYLRSNLDFETECDIPVEAKTSARSTYTDKEGREHRWGPSGSDEVPAEYLCQVQTQIACKGVDHGYIAALIGGSDFRVYRVERSDKIIASIREEAAAFWCNHVMLRDIPPHDWKHPRTPEFVAMLTRHTPGTKIELPIDDPVYVAVQRFHAVRELAKLAEAAKGMAKARILELIGDVAEVRFPDGTKVVRSQVNRREFTTRASSHEECRVTWKGEPIALNLNRAVPGLDPVPTLALEAAEEV